MNCDAGFPCDLELTYHLLYYVGTEFLCSQHIHGEGEFLQGLGSAIGCDDCTADFFLSNFNDVTHPANDGQCDPKDYNDADQNYGERFMTDGSWGDFGRGVMVNAGAHQALGDDYSTDGTLTHDALVSDYEDAGLTYAGLLFWDSNYTGSIAELFHDADVFNGVGGALQFVPAMVIYFDDDNTDADPYDEDGLEGDFGGHGTFWLDLE
ncbi:MAG: hypothetical protein GY898_22110 [Proteobacteria bacterium]|nr:hypothetical protein [Pseudomonadota bacterium]